ncbi:MAG: asparagine synthase (glutamine-hydrolyzing), partial [Deltaproteobacteria bacterium]
MCGFFGVIFKNSNDFSIDSLLLNARPILETRGPDHWETVLFEDGVLASARLEIRGAEEGKQPIQIEAEKWLAYNGEIYNFESLDSTYDNLLSDTYHLADYLKNKKDIAKLDGMFAFSISSQDEVVLIRDRFGIKPLFYINTQDYFAWSSDARALFPLVKKQLSKKVMAKYMAFNYLPGNDHIFSDIKKVPPGYKVVFKKSKNELCFERYADITDGSKDQLKGQLNLAIKIQTSLGKREHGVYFSGGMDSTLLALYSKDLKPSLFHVHFEESVYSEHEKALEMAKKMELSLHQTTFTAKDFIHYLPEFVKGMPSPLADPGHYPLWKLNKWIKENHKAKYLLSGDGADELFCGYQTFAATWIHQKITHLPMSMRSFLAHLNLPLGSINETKIGIDYKINKFLSGANLPSDIAHFFWRNVFHPEQISLLIESEMTFTSLFEDYFTALDEGKKRFGNDNINSLLYADMKTWLVDNNLYKVDHASSSFGLEARVPYLSNDLVSTAFSIPGKDKFKLIKNKPQLRRILEKELPAECLKNKSPFQPPYQKWFQNELYQFAKDSLSEGVLYSDYFDQKQFKLSINSL